MLSGRIAQAVQRGQGPALVTELDGRSPPRLKPDSVGADPCAESGFDEPIARHRQGAQDIPEGKVGRNQHKQNNKHLGASECDPIIWGSSRQLESRLRAVYTIEFTPPSASGLQALPD